MSDRFELAKTYVSSVGGDPAALKIVAGDASNRKYYRFVWRGQTVILMDSPLDKGEDIRPFLKIAEDLKAHDLSAPAILDADETLGFAILEDLGDALYARLLDDDLSLETQLYDAACDVLVHLTTIKNSKLETYSAAKMAPLAALAARWHLGAIAGRKCPDETYEIDQAAHRLLAPFDSAETVMTLRDYHAENLIWLPDRTGISRVGLLDFQDAMLAHPAYDLVSVLQDARRDVSPATVTSTLNRYISQRGLDAAQFRYAYACLGLQRNLRILGVFARLCVRDGKLGYVDLIPRVWAHVQTNLWALENSDLTTLIHEILPKPDEANLQKLRDQCGQNPML